MPQNYSGRVLLILVVLLVSLVAIFWPSVANPRQVGFNPDVPWSSKLNLRPGIDIVGGTSLLYQIQQPENAQYDPGLAEKVMTALKRRVDPQGVMNLIWRPQGSDRLEIQMPFSGTGGDSGKHQKALEEARAALEKTNIKVSDAVAAVEKDDPQARQAALDKLAAGQPDRKKILDEMAAAYDAIQKADAERNVEARIAAEERYIQAQQKLAETNLPASELERTLALKASRQSEVSRLKKEAAGYPERLKAIEAYLAAANALEKSPGGLESASDLKRLLRGSGVLEFHILASAFPGVDMQQWGQRLRTEGPRVKAGDEYRWFEVEKPDEFKGSGVVEYNDRHWVLASIRPEDSLDKQTGEWALKNAYRTSDNLGVPVVGFQFDTLGGKFFGDLTTKHVGKPMAIMLDGRVISAPNIQEPITGGSGTINGGSDGFDAGELDYLIRMLSAGSLPAQLDEEPISERTVGPQLGEDNLRRGLLACGLGLVVVAFFLIGYYYLSGVVAYAAVLLNLVIILGAMAAINATFTLPGIAALILTVGSAVDANVLIFERLREEQMRGLSLRMAVRNAYDRAFSAIFDSNMTALITSFFLVILGTEEVKGFGITLIIGLLASLFTSLFVTKTIFGLLIEKFDIRRLGSLPMSFPKWDQMLRPNVNWMRWAGAFGTFSFVVVALGVFLFVKYIRAGQMFDIEFASGTAVTFEIKTPQKQEEVRTWIDRVAKERPQALPAPSLQRVGDEGTTWEVTTPNPDARAVREAILAAVGKNLKAELPSTFTGLNVPVDAAVKQGLIIPLNSANLAGSGAWPNQFVPPEAREHAGGAAIVLNDLSPPLSASEISERIKRQILQDRGTRTAAQQATEAPVPDFDVVGISGKSAAAPDAPVTSAVILASNTDLPYEKDVAKWQEGVAGSIWTLAGDAIARPPDLQQVKNFDASVAGDTQRDALIAMTLSIFVIMAYIWFRFGNLKYGTATVIALMHDVAFTLAAIGFAHALSGNRVADWLLLEPFRINLTIVAGILTVMGYSMLDTIVVFDRIRELRGKYGHLSRQVINDGINQTLSRTLLTAGTTVVSLAIMYFVGGPGIHGFTYVLFVGILVGTYSSIAIAAPILLIGRAPEEATGRHKERHGAAGHLQRAGA